MTPYCYPLTVRLQGPLHHRLTESMRQMKKIGDDVEAVVEGLLRTCRASIFAECGALSSAEGGGSSDGGAVEQALVGVEAQLLQTREAIARQLGDANQVLVLLATHLPPPAAPTPLAATQLAAGAGDGETPSQVQLAEGDEHHRRPPRSGDGGRREQGGGRARGPPRVDDCILLRVLPPPSSLGQRSWESRPSWSTF